MARPAAAASLTELGFTDTESRAYVAVLESGPVTGYRVAQRIGKAGANTYKALESLARRGAIVCEHGETALYRAVDPKVLAQRMTDAYAARSRRVAEALAHIGEPLSDQRVYRLDSAELAYARCEEMLRSARRSAYVDAFPTALDRVRPLLEAAARRGVAVAVKAYAPACVAGALVATPTDASDVIERWPGEWLNLAVDGASMLLAFFERGGDVVRQAVWTDSAYIAVVYQGALAGEIGMAYVEQELDGIALPQRARRALRRASALGHPDLLRAPAAKRKRPAPSGR
jgi:sugar-specific transcriptional regulator TrmB